MEGFKFEKAMRLLVTAFPEKTKKPALFHSIRVGTYLRNHNYNENIQVAGLLHDALEDTSMEASQIEELFGGDVLEIVKANSENPDIEDKFQKEDIVKRCSEIGENALIVKMADVYDNFKFYTKQNNISELQRCKNFAQLILKYKKKEWNDTIFQRANEIINNK